MGISFQRDYEDIVEELSSALREIEDINEFMEMKKTVWDNMEEKIKIECLHTLSSDLIYGLDYKSDFSVGRGKVEYEEQYDHIKVITRTNRVMTIDLI